MANKKMITVNPDNSVTAICPRCHAEYEIDIPPVQIGTTMDVAVNADIHLGVHVTCPKCLKKCIAVDCATFSHDLVPFARKFINAKSFATMTELYAPGCIAGKLDLIPDKNAGFRIVHKPAVISFYTPEKLSSALTSPQNILKKFIGIPYGWYIRKNPNKELEDHVFDLVESPVDTDVPRIRTVGFSDREIEGQMVKRNEVCAKRREINFETLETWLDEVLIPTWTDSMLMAKISMDAERIQRGNDD